MTRWTGWSFASLSVAERLALEMAANEEEERYVLAGELQLLRRAWEEAEEVAAITDRLLVPPEIDRKIAEWRRRLRHGAPVGRRGDEEPQLE